MLGDKVTFKRAFKCSLEIKCSKVCYPVQRQENLERHGLDDGLRGCCLRGARTSTPVPFQASRRTQAVSLPWPRGPHEKCQKAEQVPVGGA